MMSHQSGYDRRGVAIVGNPYSGANDNLARIKALAWELRQRGIEVRQVWDLDELAAATAEPDFARQFRAVVAAGGDGTLNCVINRRVPVPLAMFPLGNENLFARQFDQSSDPRTAAATIAAGKTLPVDLGRAGDRLFSIVASAGFDGDAAHRLAEWRRRSDRLKRVRSLSYLRPIATAALRYRYPIVEVEADGQRRKGALVMVFNLPQYANHLPLAPDARVDDGLLDWLVFARPGSVPLMRYALDVWRGRHRDRPDVFFGRAKRVLLSCQEPTPLEIDGEAAGFAPVEIEAVPAAIDVIVP
ncbi:MAG TPA: diacylglycerol kinase family protein [Pirellulales bacterium]|jgi:YegS/Rv2252/BmrU family lipid kinase|nr:diacylglycerol kinase family protein [Pirellulales bacterium]